MVNPFYQLIGASKILNILAIPKKNYGFPKMVHHCSIRRRPEALMPLIRRFDDAHKKLGEITRTCEICRSYKNPDLVNFVTEKASVN
jgi:hypothetical protein